MQRGRQTTTLSKIEQDQLQREIVEACLSKTNTNHHEPRTTKELACRFEYLGIFGSRRCDDRIAHRVTLSANAH